MQHFKVSVIALALLVSACAKSDEESRGDLLRDCRFKTVESHEFERIGVVNTEIYQCTRGVQTCHVYLAVDRSAVTTDCKQY